jgi:hypothetical protein
MSAAEAILRTVVSLPRFTVVDLVAICDLPAATVRTVLRRNEDWFQEVGTADTGKRGGRWKEYEPTAAAFAALSAQEGSGSRHVPAGIKGVEELLLPPGVGQLSQMTAESLLYRARRFRREVPMSPSLESSAVVHVGIADALIALTEAEISGDADAWRRLHEGLRGLSRQLGQSEPELEEAVEKRFVASRLAQPVTVSVTGYEVVPQEGRRPWHLVLAEIVDLVSNYVSAQPDEAEVIFVRGSLPTGREIAIDSRRRAIVNAQATNPLSLVEWKFGPVGFVDGGDRPARRVVGTEVVQGNQLGVWNSAECEPNTGGLMWP